MNDFRIVNLKAREMKTIRGVNVKLIFGLILVKVNLLNVLSTNIMYAGKMKSAIILFIILFLHLSVKAQCSLKTTKDPCDDIVTRSAVYENVTGTPRVLKLKIEQNITFKDTSTRLFILLTPAFKSCLGTESKISINSGKDIITLPFSGQITCKGEGEKLIDYAELTKGSIDFLKGHTINSVRVTYINSYDDFIIKKQDYFIRTLKCFESAF